MLSIPLIKENIREYIRILAVTAGVLVLYLSFVILTYAPDGKAEIFKMFSLLPPVLQAAFGIGSYGTSMTAVLGGCFIENAGILLPLFFAIPVSADLVAAKMESGELVWSLSTPAAREKVLFTQIFSFVSALLVLFIAAALTGVFCVMATEISTGAVDLIKICLGGFCLHFFLGGILFLLSSLGDEKALTVVMGSVVLAVFYLIKLLSGLGGTFAYLRYLTIFSLYQTADMIEGSFSFVWKDFGMLLLGVVFYWLSIRVFEKRDLPL